MTQDRILIVEDESSISDTVEFALSREGFVTAIARTGDEALRQAHAFNPALIILDVGLPDLSGFDVCRRIRASSRVPIIFLTAKADEVDRVLGLELGGDDYVAKPFSPRELIARIRAVLRRLNKEPQTPPKGSQSFKIDADRMQIIYQGKALDLSRYEFRLLSILVRRPGRVYSREELMDRAWESPEMSLERTVDSHIKMVRAKLRAINPEDDSIITHRGFGYSLREDQ